MISRTRLQVDSIAQLCLLLLSLGFLCLNWNGTALIFVLLLAIWQTGSALELYLDYDYQNRRNFLFVLPAVIISSIIFREHILYLAGAWALAYVIRTLRDYRIVLRRPKSFWEL